MLNDASRARYSPFTPTHSLKSSRSLSSRSALAVGGTQALLRVPELHPCLVHRPATLINALRSRAIYLVSSAMDSTSFPCPRHMASPINFNQFLEKEKLKSNGSNFTDWFRHVRIFLNGGNLQYVLDAPLGDPPAGTDEVKSVYATRKTRCMMEEGSSISEHMLVMTGHAKKLDDLGIVIPNRLGINRVLQSLPPSYKNFVMNYNIQNMNKEFPELFGMLKAAEIEIKKEHQVLMVNKTTSFKKQGKSKGKFKKGGKKAATPPMKPKNGPKRLIAIAQRRDTGSVIAPSIWQI
ncbi:hypothetical protein QYE76_004676 [Lolium multiflorum]|uniref:Zinc finger, CCHC-type n=1 Tax=Lolium multiflorum TaxID=4521 RepID=A0AAD8W2P6_LOLMU|nr:hypothetical protein QYE76_004676 [Lolium multiflorum]